MSNVEAIRAYRAAKSAGEQKRATRLRDAIVKDNLALVWKVAKRTLGARAANPDNLVEAVQEGSFGLLRAIEDFDEAKGAFSTYAGFWIRHHVQTCAHRQVDFAKQRPAMMPATIAKAANKFRLLRGREPEACDLGVDPEQWARWQDAAHVVSFDDEPEGQSDVDNRAHGSRVAGMLVDESTYPEAVDADQDLRDKIDAALHKLSPRQRDMTRAFFLEGRTLEDVGAEFGLSIARVHQLKGVLERRLREVLVA